MASMMQNPEPEFMPIVLGPASELFITDCRMMPETLSPIPANSPPTARGSRTAVIRVLEVEPVFKD